MKIGVTGEVASPAYTVLYLFTLKRISTMIRVTSNPILQILQRIVTYTIADKWKHKIKSESNIEKINEQIK